MTTTEDDPVVRRSALGRRALGFALAGAAVSAALVAGVIRIDSSTECSNRAGRVDCRAHLANGGSETARAIELTIETAGSTATARVDSLDPGATSEVKVALDVAGDAVGRYPVVQTLAYRDDEGYPMSSVSVLTLDFAGGGADLPVETSLASVRMERLSAATELSIRNVSARPITCHVGLVTPLELSARVDRATIELAPGEEIALPVTIDNRGSLPPSRYAIHALVESDGEAGRTTAIATASLEVGTPPGPTVEHPGLTFALALALFALGAVPALSNRFAGAAGSARAVDLLVLLGATGFLLLHLRPDLLTLETITTGGDTASHYYTAQYLRGELLPQGRILGWMPGALGGFPVFQLYFPLPFLLMMPLAEWVGLPIAFKTLTVAGTLLLPLAAYLGLFAFGFRRPVPALGSVATLPFLFHEANSVWGGNLPSTLAGEFTYSFALALVVLFAGTSFRALVTGRRWVPNAILLGAIGLSHAYALLFAAAVATLHLVWAPNPRRAFVTLTKIGLLAFALIGFWIVPLIAFSGYTSPYADLWRIEGWAQVIPPLLWPAAGLALLLPAAALLRRRSGDRIDARHGALATGIIAAIALYFAARPIGVVDIRFLPFAQVWISLLGAVAIGWWMRRSLRPIAAVLAPALLLVAVAGWIDRTVELIPSWVQWNYSGFENRPAWPTFQSVNRAVQGDVSDPRVVFEHSPAHNAAGSIRAFESLPLFSGRSTLEGLYIQSSILTPEIFYLQSEISPIASCPLPDFHCARVSAERAAVHLRQFNVDRVIAHSDETRAMLAESTDFSSVEEVGPYEIFQVADGSDRYVVPLGERPIGLRTDNWRRDAFRWFTREGTDSVVLVDALRGAALPADVEIVDGLPDLIPRSALRRSADSVRVSEQISNHEIRIETDAPGHPLLVRVAYHPRWQVRGAKGIHLASPGFMLLYPEESTVVLEFGETAATWFGKTLTALGLLVLILSAAHWVSARRRRTIDRPPLYVPAWHLAPWIVTALLVASIASAPLYRGEFAPHLFDEGIDHYHAERFDAAKESFGRTIQASPLSSAALSAHFYRGLCAYRQESWREVIDLYDEMIRRFPDTKHRAEAEYHIGIAHERLGTPVRAVDIYRQLIGRFPDSPWGERAGQRLRRLADEIA